MTRIDTKDYLAWMKAGFDLWMLGAEAGTVMTLRMARIAAGGAAGVTEAELMVSEKIHPAIELQNRLMAGALGTTPLGISQATLRHYRLKVAANNKRLAKA